MLRVPDECAYYKEDAGKMLLGAFEPVAKPWGMDGIREDFCFDQLPEDFDHFEPILEMAINRMPMLRRPPASTPSSTARRASRPTTATTSAKRRSSTGYWIAAGYNSIGIVSSGGAGMALAQWINDGEPPFDLWEVDIRRAQPFQKNRRYLKERVTETLGLLYADHFPYRQMATARGVRRSPLHEHLKARGAVFGEVAGWERANWFANPGQEREYRYSWKRQNWFDNQRAEHMAVRERRRPVRHDLVRQDPGRGPRCLRLPATPLRQRGGRGAGPHRLHADAQRARRHRERPDGDAAFARRPSCWSCRARRLQRDLAWLRRACGR